MLLKAFKAALKSLRMMQRRRLAQYLSRKQSKPQGLGGDLGLGRPWSCGHGGLVPDPDQALL